MTNRTKKYDYNRYTKVLLPFSPGIPWTIKNKKYIVPEINSKIWNRVFEGYDFIITCYGGLLESFFSLSFVEAISKIEPYRNITWMGKKEFEPIVQANSLCKINKFNLGSDVLKDYPAPVFMDKENHAYFNSLNNYIVSKSYLTGYHIKQNKDIVLKQIYDNLMLPWDNNIPIIRNPNNIKFNQWLKSKKLHQNSNYALVFPKSLYSIHDETCLNWDDRQVRELSEMLRHKNISVISYENMRYDPYYSSGSVIRALPDLELMLSLIMNAKYILAKDIDIHLISMMISDANIISEPCKSPIYSLYDNLDFLGIQKDIIVDDLTPKIVFSFIEELTNMA